MFKKIGAFALKAAKPVLKTATVVAKSPLSRAIPIVGPALTAYGAYQTAKKVFGKPTQPSGLPIPPFMGAKPGTLYSAPLAPRQPAGLVEKSTSPFVGPGGRLQLPFTGAEIPDAIKAFALDDRYLMTYYKAPRGYVVVRDADGKPFPLNKKIAQQMGYWKPAKKPLLSIRDTQSIKRAGRAIEKLKKASKTAKKIANWKGC